MGRIWKSLGSVALVGAFVLVTAATRHGRSLDLSDWPGALLWGGIVLATGLAAIGLVAALLLLISKTLGGTGPGPRRPDAAQLAKARRFAQEQDKTEAEIVAPTPRTLDAPARLRLEAAPEAAATRAGWRKLAWRHVGWTFLLVGFLYGVPGVAFFVAAGPVRPPPWAWFVLAGYALYGLALVVVTRGPVPPAGETPGWMRMLLVWEMRRYGYPLLFPIVALLPLGLLFLVGGP